MSTALSQTRVAVAAQITDAVAGLSSPVTVLSYEPPTVTGTTVTVATAGLSGIEALLYVRVYVSTVQTAEGQDLLDDVVYAIDTYAGLRVVPRSQWAWFYDQTRDVFLMQTTLTYPRDDF